MADYKFGDGIRTFFLAGVGAVALTAEKSQEIIGELVKKGELTVEQGKELNKDLQRSFKESMDKKGVNIDEISQKISKMSTDELARIKEQIAAAEKIVSERFSAAEEEGAEVVEEVKEAAEEASDEAAEKAEEAKDEAAEAVEEAKDKAAEVVEDAKDKAAEVAEEVKKAAADAVE